MDIDARGAEWRDWVLRNLTRGCAPQDMLDSMVKAGWAGATARAALIEGGRLLGREQALPARHPDIDVGANELDCGAHKARILMNLHRPRAVLLDSVLTTEECDQLVDLAEDKGLIKSGVVDRDTGDTVDHGARTSSGAGFRRGETAFLAMIEARLAGLSNWPVAHGEGIQVLRYGPGQEYRPHFDWFNPDTPGGVRHLERGGQRVGTFVIYLTDVEAGGGTVFPELGLEVFPRKGGGVFFADVDALGKPDKLSLHGGMPVVRGVKVVATYWQRESVYG